MNLTLLQTTGRFKQVWHHDVYCILKEIHPRQKKIFIGYIEGYYSPQFLIIIFSKLLIH